MEEIIASMRFKYLFTFSLIFGVALLFNACTADEEITQTPVSDSYIEGAKKILKDSIAVKATAMQGTVNKTLLPEGCPIKYHLKWLEDDRMNLQIHDFSVGAMPLTISFSINLKFMQLNSWEKEEYKGKGWIKFEGSKGFTTYTGNTPEYESGTGGAGTVQGYLNVNTMEIEMVTNFGVMNFSSDVYLQKIDPSMLERFDEEFAQYEEDLAEYKKEHGIS